MTRADVAALAAACKLRVIAIDRTPTHWLVSVEHVTTADGRDIDGKTIGARVSSAEEKLGLPQTGATWGTLPADGYDLLRIGDLE